MRILRGGQLGGMPGGLSASTGGMDPGIDLVGNQGLLTLV